MIFRAFWAVMLVLTFVCLAMDTNRPRKRPSMITVVFYLSVLAIDLLGIGSMVIYALYLFVVTGG